jgi:hypothetical protein
MAGSRPVDRSNNTTHTGMTMKTTRTMSYALLTIVMLAAATIISIGLLRYYKSRTQTLPVSTLLTERGIPVLPASAKIDHQANGGWLDRFLFIKATVPEPDFQQYKEAVAARHKSWLPSGPGDESSQGRIEMGVTDELAEAPGKFASWFTPERS